MLVILIFISFNGINSVATKYIVPTELVLRYRERPARAYSKL
ncbi:MULTISPECIES: hypothetical protein [Flavobacterium]|nr:MULTISPECIES: hypothetical protein [Flavobacterium]